MPISWTISLTLQGNRYKSLTSPIRIEHWWWFGRIKKQGLRTHSTTVVKFTTLLRHHRSLITELSSKGLVTLIRCWVYPAQTFFVGFIQTKHFKPLSSRIFFKQYQNRFTPSIISRHQDTERLLKSRVEKGETSLTSHSQYNGVDNLAA